MPIKFNDEVVGGIELASFKEFAPYHISFIEKIGETIATTLLSAKNNQRTQLLLKEFQLMTEQMRAQEEEMRQNMEELQATQEQLRQRVSENDRQAVD